MTAFVTNATPTKANDDAMNTFLEGDDATIKKGLADAETRFRRGFASGGEVDKLAFPTVEDVRRYLAADPRPRLPMMLTTVVEGHLPKEVRIVSFRYPEVIDTVIQTVEFPYKEPVSEPVEAGRSSTTLPIPTAEEVARLASSMSAPTRAGKRGEEMSAIKPKPKRVPLTVAAKSLRPPKTNDADGRVAPRSGVEDRGGEGGRKKGKTLIEPKWSRQDASPSLEGEGRVGVDPKKTNPPAPEPSKPTPTEAPPQTTNHKPQTTPPSSTFLTYLRMGYTHILPEGLDHILFVLGLFLLGSNAKALLKQITAFTVAHSITLALATLNLVRLPSRIIEPLIAVSIAFVAIENLTTKEVRPWRTAVVFLFGLVHGMGFAEVFRDAGLSGGGLLTALLSFNVGVELGQLSVVALALLTVGWFRRDARYRSYVVVPASLAIAAVALFWTVERFIGS